MKKEVNKVTEQFIVLLFVITVARRVRRHSKSQFSTSSRDVRWT